MSDFKLSVLAGLIAMTACSAAAHETETASIAGYAPAPPHFESNTADALSCEVTAERTANGVLIEAHAYADQDVDGEYDFVITKSGGGGSSDVNQGGAVSIAAGTSQTLGQTELSVERGARIRANLIVSDEHGELCRRSFRL